MFRQSIVAAAAVAMLGAFSASMAETKAEAKVETAAHKSADATRHAAHKTAKVTHRVTHKKVKATHKVAHTTRHVTHVRPVMHGVKEAPDFRAATTREQRIAEAQANWQRSRKM